jgi:hypothetical protein
VTISVEGQENWQVLFIGDDWAQDHHDVEVMNPTGKRLARARLPEGVDGIARFHELVAEHLNDDGEAGQVVVGIETDRGPWVAALTAAGYTVFAVNPLQAARYRERHTVSGAKSDPADAHVLADMVRTDSHQLRPVAADSAAAEALKVLARTHKTLIWERTRHTNRLRHALREYFPAALGAFGDLTAPDTLELLAKAPEPVAAARLSLKTDPRRPHPGPPPRCRGQGRPHPSLPASRTFAPRSRYRRRLRGDHPGRGSGADRPARADRRVAGAGGGTFWPAPGR